MCTLELPYFNSFLAASNHFLRCPEVLPSSWAVLLSSVHCAQTHQRIPVTVEHHHPSWISEAAAHNSQRESEQL